MNRRERESARMTEREEQLHARVLAAGPSWTGQHGARLGAGAVAALVYAFTFALAAFAVWALVAWSNRLFGILTALLVGWVLWESRPRRPRLPDQGVLAPDEAPVLRGLLEEIGERLGTPPPSTIVLDRRINASVIGGRGGRRLAIGVPLWLALSPQARVALLAHELGHFASGDTRRTLWVGGALNILRAWTVMLRGPAHELGDRFGYPSPEGVTLDFLHVVSRAIMWVFGAVPYALGRILLRITRRDARGAEYAADVHAWRIAGRDGALELLTCLQREAGLTVALQRAAMAPGGDVLAAAASFRPEGPAPTADAPRPSNPLDTHPPVGLRLEVVAALPPFDGEVRLDSDRVRRMEAELAARMREIERRIRDSFL